MIELALIGKGNWGKNYETTIPKIPEAHLDPKNIRTRDYAELFDKKGIKGVIIASPSSTHYQIAREFMKRGFNLLIEKPVTTTHEEALKLQELNIKYKVIVAVGHIQIYDPGYIKLKSSVSNIGNIKHITFKGLQSPMPQDGTTVIENWGPHPIYLFMDIAGSSPIHVETKPTTEDNIHLQLDFEGNLTGIADIGSISPTKERQLSVVGDRGSLTLDWSGPTKRLYFKNNKGKEQDIPFDTSRSPLELEVLEFINCIKTGKEPKTPLSQGIEVVKIIESAQKSIKH